MSLRSFTDSAGHRWEVWEAHVRAVDRRVLADRRSVKRNTFERRIRAFLSHFLGFEKGSGWLVFRSALGKWRLSPVPEHWEQLSDVALHRLVARAVRAGDNHISVARTRPSGEHRAM